MMVHVLLLRQPSEDVPDSYEDHFCKAGYHPFSLPVLETAHLNLGILSDLVRDGLKVKGFNGVIITSQRSCEALANAFKLLKDEEQLRVGTSGIERCGNTMIAGWDGVPIYVVGEKTASSLRDIFAQFTNINPASIDIRGQESGSGANLATFILSDVHGRSGTKLLYLTGDKNRDTISRKLAGENIRLEPLEVYRTQKSLSFESRLSSVLEIAPKGATHWWIVYFAPSTASFVAPILENYFHLQEVSDSSTESSDTLLPTRIAVIGPTTRAFLIEQLRLRVDAMAEKPAPQDLVSAVENFDRKNKISDNVTIH